ncbi:GATA transcription factor 1-like isoform X1 [Cucurbita maxima]|uniref:GATA transcription factor n=1 Tax=Cucurbita maxima TaxID=3661 RepID=A0A6J1KXF9_CUCMA|nr:GATA transcription factor 1-like isoform X1 [Cucurbita maxima]
MESSLAFMDDLLDFSSDIGGEDEEDDAVPPFSVKPKAAAVTDSSEFNAGFHPEDSSSCRVLPEEDYAEEELEWLSNEDVFPAVETFVDILSDHHHPQPPSLMSVSKQNSPVSVLETTSISSHGGNKPSAHGSILMSCCDGLKVPGKARSKRRRGRHISGHHLWFKQQPSSRNVKQILPITIATATTAAAVTTAKTPIGRKCLHCGAEKTPQWRAGPYGPKTLCNACGVRYKSGRLVPEYRPASSPTFSPELHSNSHRKVMEMRRQKQFGMVVNPMDKG